MDTLQESHTPALETCWISPVAVALPNGDARIVQSPNEACTLLEGEWPVQAGNHHEHALLLCRSAAKRLTSAEMAREAFVAACIEADSYRPGRAARP